MFKNLVSRFRSSRFAEFLSEHRRLRLTFWIAVFALAALYLVPVVSVTVSLVTFERPIARMFWAWWKWGFVFHFFIGGAVVSLWALVRGILEHRWHFREWGAKSVSTIFSAAFVALLGFWYCFPLTFARTQQFLLWHVVYDWMGTCILVTTLIVGCVFFLARKSRKGAMVFAGCVCVAGLIVSQFWKTVGEENRLKLALSSDVIFIDAPDTLECDRENPRYTPHDVAFEQSRGQFNRSDYRLRRELFQAMDIDGEFLFTTPVSPDPPDALWTRLFAPTPEVRVFNDSPDLKDDQRVQIVKTNFVYGENRLGPTQLRSLVARWDMFCEDLESEVNYCPIPTEDGKKEWVQLVRKKSYKLSFKVFPPVRIPYWRGVTIVFQDGRSENLSPEEAKDDPRLQKLVLVPESLFLDRVNAQAMAGGIMESVVKKFGVPKVPKLPGKNQFPHLLPGADKDPYFGVITTPQGDSEAMLGYYWGNAHDDTCYRFIFPEDDPRIGPVYAINELQSRFEAFWSTGKDDSAGYQGLESKLWSRGGGKLSYQIPVVGHSHQDVTWVGIVDSKRNTHDMLRLQGRSEFMDWVRFGDSLERKLERYLKEQGTLNKKIEELRKLIEEKKEN